MRDLLDYLVKSLVSKPEAVVIDEVDQEGGIQVNLTVAPEDMGLVIGKNGQTIKSLRRMLGTRAMAENGSPRVFLNLVEVAAQ